MIIYTSPYLVLLGEFASESLPNQDSSARLRRPNSDCSELAAGAGRSKPSVDMVWSDGQDPSCVRDAPPPQAEYFVRAADARSW